MVEFMLVVLLWTNSGIVAPVEHRYPFESMRECQLAVGAAQIDVADAGDSEGGVVIFCAPFMKGGDRQATEYAE